MSASIVPMGVVIESTELSTYRQEMKKELKDILDYWMKNTPDQREGGFYGQIDGENNVHPDAPKGVVLNSRILRAFSAAYNHCRAGHGAGCDAGVDAGRAARHDADRDAGHDADRDAGDDAGRAAGGGSPYLDFARRAYQYLADHFFDNEYGGVYWSVDHDGSMLNGRKQIYGLAFCLYGLSEYYLATGEQGALDQAIGLFRLIEQHSYDKDRKGYYEAFTRDWQILGDLRLSPKDANEKKTMNTHLHVIEAYANLYRAWPDDLLKKRIGGLLDVFDRHIIDHGTWHLRLFFNEEWEPRSPILSYGHDIEAAWLLQESAEIIADVEWIEASRGWALKIATAAAEGLDSDGGLWYEKEQGHLVREKHSWPQAEAMIGFLNAYQLSGDKTWLDRSLAVWKFVKSYIKDPRHGEWFWGVEADHLPMPGQDKAGFWKCPYHNSRACMEISRRLQKYSS